MRFALSGLLILLLAFPLVGRAAEWRAGTEVAWSGLGDSLTLPVYLPEDYTPERAWPLIYCFSGTGGRASTRLLRRHTDGQGYILVGAPYAVPGEGSLSRQGVLAEIQRIATVRAALGESLRLQERTFVAGFSKGGWMADLLATEGFPTLAGALILGAGRIPADVGRVLERKTTAIPAVPPQAIYIGVGQSDTNHVYSRRAAQHYRQSGHAVVFEEYLARGHQPGDANAILLSQWLRVHAQANGDRDALGREAVSWWVSALASAEAISAPIERLLYLEMVLAAPFAALVAPEPRAELARTLQRVRSHRSLKREMDARASYQKAQRAEEATRRSSELGGVAETFARVHAVYAETVYGQRAALDLDRIARSYRTLRGAQGAGEVPFPQPTADVAVLRARFAHLGRVFNGGGNRGKASGE